VPKGGGTATPYPTSPDPRDIVVDPVGPWVSWLSLPWLTGDGGGGGALVTYSPSGKRVTVPLAQPSGLVAHAGWLYFYETATARLERVPQGVADAAPESGTGSTWTWLPEGGIGTAPAQVIAVDSARAFIRVYDASSFSEIVEVSMCGGAPRLRARVDALQGKALADDTFLYWGLYGGPIYRMAK
jgi:hypothetical protein